jgi:hypothetical protein
VESGLKLIPGHLSESFAAPKDQNSLVIRGRKPCKDVAHVRVSWDFLGADPGQKESTCVEKVDLPAPVSPRSSSRPLGELPSTTETALQRH